MRKFSGDSRNAAMAAWAAWDQGKFWEMHDLLFEHAPELERPELDELARKLGLDMARFTKTMDGMIHLQELNQNLDRVHALDIWSTPTVIINGHVLKGVRSYESYKTVIDQAMKEVASDWEGRFLGILTGFFGPTRVYAEGSSFGRGTVPLYIKVPPAKPVNEPKTGEEAPDFTLPSVDGRKVTLSSFRGKKNVLLTFLPAAFTPV
jgi:hypothetical protein